MAGFLHHSGIHPYLLVLRLGLIPVPPEGSIQNDVEQVIENKYPAITKILYLDSVVNAFLH
jgi:hypothetical protein